MALSRPRATDLDYPHHQHHQRDQHHHHHHHHRAHTPSRSPSPTHRRSPSRRRSRTPPPSHHYNRRPSPEYDSGAHRDSHPRDRLTPERPLGHHSHSRSGGPANAQFGNQRNDVNLNNAYRQGGRDDYFESRRIERENSQVSFWPRSPRQAYGEDKQKKKHRHERSTEKEDRRSKDKKHKVHQGKTKSKQKKERVYSSESEDSERSERRRGSKKHKQSSHKRRRAESVSGISTADEEAGRRRKGKARSGGSEEEEEDVWAEKEPAAVVVVHRESVSGPALPVADEHVETDLASDSDASDAAEVGPMPYNPVTGKAMDPKEFGRALRPGEGSAMAAFIEAGERIPRRGEIGLTGTQIEKYETAGYVMSGSRHRRMNAVRIRKENQVISAEEKRGILKMQAEEKAKREGQIISSFRELVDTKLQETG